MRKSKFLFVILQFLLVSILLACEKDSENSTLTVSSDVLSLDSAGGSYDIYIESNTMWAIEVLSTELSVNGGPLSNSSSEFNVCNWINVENRIGEGNACVSINVSPSDILTPREAILVVHTIDGRVTRNIKVIQGGTEFGENVFNVFSSDRSDKAIFGGRKNGIDSVYVMTNLLWEIQGPEWLEIKINQSDWYPSSESIVHDGWAIVSIRPSSMNKGKDDRRGTLVFTEMTNTFEPIEFEVEQLGCYSVRINNYISLADGFACDFIYGSDVASFQIKAFENKVDVNELNWGSIKQWQNFSADDDLLVSWGGLKEKTRYEIVAIGLGENDEHSTKFSANGIVTKSSVGQAVAEIADVSLLQSGWEWQTIMNDLTSSYLQFVSTNMDLDQYPDAYFAWILSQNSDEEYEEDYYWSLPYKDDIIITTWAKNKDFTPSGIICKYSSDENAARATSTAKKNVYCVGGKKENNKIQKTIKYIR